MHPCPYLISPFPGRAVVMMISLGTVINSLAFALSFIFAPPVVRLESYIGAKGTK